MEVAMVEVAAEVMVVLMTQRRNTEKTLSKLEYFANIVSLNTKLLLLASTGPFGALNCLTCKKIPGTNWKYHISSMSQNLKIRYVSFLNSSLLYLSMISLEFTGY